MGAARIGLALLVVSLASACGSDNIGDPLPPGTSGFNGGFGQGFTSGTSGSERDSNTLEGPRSFDFPNASIASRGSADSGAQIFIDDGSPGCYPSSDGATNAVRVGLPGAVGIGSYNLDAGASVALFYLPGSRDVPLLSAVSGTVYVNRADDVAVGGNFDVMLAWPDGGIDSELAGIFSAAVCF